MSTIITAIDRHSPAEKAGIQVGEQLLTINGHTIVDVLDYRFYGYDPLSRVELKTASGDVRTVTIRKAEGQDLGLNFDTYLMDEMRSCANHCIFCFVDQMPPGMRSTLYFKDDDARLSFLLGNYITLTNLTEREAQRIIDLHISPINVSVHTTDPQLHCTMLGNKNAERSLDYIQAFCKAGIVMNGQIVICPGWNDGDQLRRTLRDLTEWQFSSCSLVPVGITKYRQGLAKLRPVSAEDARDIIAIAEEFGQENLRRFGTRRFFCADELYLRAGLPLPQEDYYEGYRQLENGVGMLRSLEQDFLSAMRLEDPAAALHHRHRHRRRAVPAGTAGTGQGVFSPSGGAGHRGGKRFLRSHHRRGRSADRAGPVGAAAKGPVPGAGAAAAAYAAPRRNGVPGRLHRGASGGRAGLPRADRRHRRRRPAGRHAGRLQHRQLKRRVNLWQNL